MCVAVFDPKTSCKNCDMVYVGETGRKRRTRIAEHKKDYQEVFRRAGRKQSESVSNKSAVTDHIARLNHLFARRG